MQPMQPMQVYQPAQQMPAQNYHVANQMQ